VVLNIGYRLAPETRFPGPVEDVYGVLRDVVARAGDYGIDPTAVALCGDSAGGSICVSATARALRDGIALRHLALFYPALDPACDTPSQRDLAAGPLLTQAAMRWFWACYLGTADQTDPAAVAPAKPVLQGFPPTTVATAEFDPLRDEGAAFAARLSDLGNDLQLTCYPGMVHAFLSLPVASEVADAAMRDTSKRLRASLWDRPDRA